MIKLFSHDIIKQANIQPLDYYKWVEEALKIKSNVLLPAKISIHPTADIFYNTMPCVLPEQGIAGVKLVNRYPGRSPALDSHLMLYSYETGHLLALFDANMITAMRTGAVAVHSIATLAKSDFSTVGIIGLGNTGRATLKILLEKYHDRKLTIKICQHNGQEKEVRELFQNYENATFVECANYQETICDSDVIVSCITYTDSLLADDACYQQGCTVLPVHTRGFQNCDLFFDKVFADDKSHVQGFKYFNQFKQFGEVSQVIRGEIKGRENDNERILVYNIGIALHDIYIASKLYHTIQNSDEYSMNIPAEKFWIK